MKTNPILVVTTLALGLSLGACSKKHHEPAENDDRPVLSIRVQTVEPKPHIAIEEVTGTVRAKLHSAIEAKVMGRIAKMLVAPGQKVKQDEVLAQLDARETEAKLDQARAVVDQSERDLTRYTALLTSKATSVSAFEEVQSRNRVAKAALAEAETMVGYATIKAPFHGVITRQLADVGDLASPGKSLLEIEDPAALRFEADVPEAVIGKIELGAKLPVRIGTLDILGTVSEIAPAGNPSSRTFLVKLDLPPTPGLRAGRFGRVGVPTSETSVLRMPSSAVIQRGQMELAFVVHDGLVQLRLVKTGKLIGNEIEIVSGIEANEQVATDNVAQLSDGQRVEVKSK